MADRDKDLRTELATLRARVEEQTALTKRTADALRRLAESMVAGKRKYERVLSLNSFVAYTLFTILLGGGFYLLYHSRVGELVSDHQEAVEDRDRARERAEELQGELAAREAAAGEAFRFYELIGDGRRAELLARYPEIDPGTLTPTERAVFAEAAVNARGELAGDRYESGLAAFENGEYEQAAGDLERALELETDAGRAARARYYLGVARLRLGEHDGAVRALELAVAGNVGDSAPADGRYYMAQALEGLGETDRARAAYREFATRNPRSRLAWKARRRADELAGDAQ